MNTSPPTDTSGPGRGKIAVQGLSWASFVFVADKFLTLATVAILARIFDVADFGLIATALLVFTMAGSVRDIGLREALIWNEGAAGELADTAFWLNTALGAILTLAVLAITPLLSRYFEQPNVTGLLEVLAFSFFLHGLGATHEALQDKALNFGLRYAVDLAASLAKAAITIGLALAEFGVVAVAFGILVATLVRSAGRLITYRWLPKLRASVSGIAELFHYARHIIVTTVADVFIERADQIVIIAILGNLEIGYYYIAVRIPEILIGSISIVATRIMFPVYVSINKDITHLKRYFFNATRVTGYFAIPAGVGLALVADLAIQVIFGPQWHRSASSLAVLAFCTVAYSILWSAGDVLKAVGKPAYLARVTILHLLLIFPIMFGFVMTFRTIEAGAVGLLVSLLIDNVVKFVVTKRLIGFTASEFSANFYGSALAALFMAAAVLVTRFSVTDFSQEIQLSACIASGALVYCTVLWSIERDRIITALKQIV
jgi:O-antigen/teichoic acid export membrane protein